MPWNLLVPRRTIGWPRRSFTLFIASTEIEMKIYKLTLDLDWQSLDEISYDNWYDYGIPLLQTSDRIVEQWDPGFYAVRRISFAEFYMPQEHTIPDCL